MTNHDFWVGTSVVFLGPFVMFACSLALGELRAWQYRRFGF